MRVLVACEYSGAVRDAFLRAGHYALSCDLLPSDSQLGDHYQCDVRDILDHDWDLMIAHPPCTHLAVSGARYFAQKVADGSQAEALDFVRLLLDAPIPRICVENPISIISSRIRRPEQIIQPWQFGHDASKATCLWLKGLPPLAPTRMVAPRIVDGKPRWGNQTDSGQNRLAPSADRWKLRSETFSGIAQAMAQQWSNV
jgi:hypothetical protein